jgi:hypothetical protein
MTMTGLEACMPLKVKIVLKENSPVAAQYIVSSFFFKFWFGAGIVFDYDAKK